MRRDHAVLGLCILIAAIFAAGLPGCESLRNHSPMARAVKYLQEAQQQRARGETEAALRSFEAALQENPRLVDAHLGVGDIYRERGDYERASRSYESATALAPNSFDAHYFLGLTKQLLGRVDEAVRSYLRALAIRPDSFEANQNLASAYIQLGRAADALPYAQRATELQPRSQAAWANLGTAYSLLEQYERAVPAYRQAAELGEPGSAVPEPVALGLADAHIKMGHFDRAIAVLQGLIQRQPSATAYERLGFAQFKQRRFAEALTAFRNALKLDPDDPPSLNGVGVCLMTAYLQSGRAAPDLRDEALEGWRKSLRLQPDQPHIIDLLSRYQRL